MGTDGGKIAGKDGERLEMNTDIGKEIEELKKQITPANTFKFLAGTLISFGAAAAVVAMMRNPLQSAKGLTKLLMKLGIFVLASKAGAIAEQHFEEIASETEQTIRDAYQEVKNA